MLGAFLALGYEDVGPVAETFVGDAPPTAPTPLVPHVVAVRARIRLARFDAGWIDDGALFSVPGESADARDGH